MSLIATDIDAYLAQHERKELLRFLTCGSVDDGKSTLIGRLLHDTKGIYEDQLEALRSDSARMGTVKDGIDLALLVDGLKAEREQGITIDVAYRYFSTDRRKFIIADCPGHEQYTRNMATGASTCDLAVILIDARKGVITQTRRHSFIVSLLGIRHVIVAINKMDLVGWDESIYRRIVDDYADFAARLEVEDIRFIPMSALEGDNVVEPSARMPWYGGETLLNLLDTIHIASDRNLVDFRFPVQFVNRPSHDFRGFCGTVASGTIRRGEEIVVLPSRRRTRISSIVAWEGELEEAFAPQAVTLTFADEIDCSRGDMIVRPENLPRLGDRFDAMVVWMGEDAMIPGRPYLLKQATRLVPAEIAAVRYRMDVNTMHRAPAPQLALNEIARCEVRTESPIAFDAYRRNRATGAFILIDRATNVTIGAGMILDRGTEDDRGDHWDTEPASAQLQEAPSAVAPDERRERYGQRPVTVLLTGLAGAGKSTVAHSLERRLFDAGRAVARIDGQAMRLGLSRDLGFGGEDRSENLRRGASVAKILNDAGLICIASFVAPSEEARRRAAQLVGADRFLVVHLDAPIETCRDRDDSGIYRTDGGEHLASVPGVSFPYERPETPDLRLDTAALAPDACVDRIVELLVAQGVIG